MKKLSFLIAVLCFPSISKANVTLPQIINNNMVLQRNENVRIWGWADAKEKVTVEFNNQKKTVRADKDGNWELFLDPMKAGGPFDLLVKGKNEIKLENILIGEVWICSGQSNMEWPMSRVKNSDEEVANAENPNIRIFNIQNNLQLKPVDKLPQTEWYEVTPSTIKYFSAVGYFFGKNLMEHIDVPIGLVGSNWGGTVVETWTSLESIETVEDFKNKVQQLKSTDEEKIRADQKVWEEKVKSMVTDKTDGLVDGKALWAATDLNESDWKDANIPGTWENSYLPSVDGIVWFRKTIELTEEQTKNDLKLFLGKIDDSDKTYVNGQLIGEMKDSYDLNRVYTIQSKYLKPGKNVITVRVEDTGGNGGFSSNAQVLKIVGENTNMPLAGTWKYKLSPLNLSVGNASGIGPNSLPTLLFNGMINPIKKYTVKGAIWYQGESNASRANQYRRIFPLLIEDWRKQFENENLVFLFVQLANFKQEDKEPVNSEWAELREAQTMTLSLPNTGMAVIIDIGEANDIHPRNKQDVGYRLSLAARKIAYGEDIIYSGPMYKSMKIEGDKIRISFDHTGGGLIIKNKFGYLMGFQIAGSDKKFYWAKAEVDGNDVLVHCDKVKNPVAVRYGWADNPASVNLYNHEQLPANPFRTDDWPGITQ